MTRAKLASLMAAKVRSSCHIFSSAAMAASVADLLGSQDRPPRPLNSPKSPKVVTLRRATTKCSNRRILFEGVDLRIRQGQRWVIYTKQRQAGVALLRCIAGSSLLDRGRIKVMGNISWPLGGIKALSKALSAEENSYYLAGIYGQPGDHARELECIRNMAKMEIEEWRKPIKQLSNNKMLEFKLALSLGFDFDLYVVDPLILRPLLKAGTYSTHWQSLIQERLSSSAMITLADPRLKIDRCCRFGLVLEKGKIIKQGTADDCRKLVRVGAKE